MITCAAVTYVAIAILLYKIIKIKPQPINIAFMIVLGSLMLCPIVILWKYSSPMANNVVVTRYSVPLVPQVGGPIARIVAEPNVPLTKGKDILFEIQRAPYEMSVRQTSASLASARTKIDQLSHGIESAAAAIKKAEAGLAAAKAELDVALATQRLNADAISTLTIKQLQAQLGGAVAGLDQARAAELQAASAKKSAEESVVGIEAQLERAQFNLDRCTVFAPADGFVTNWQAREGTMAAPSSAAALGTFIDTSQMSVVAGLPQNIVCNVKPGDKVEFAFKSKPAEIVTGVVEEVIQATGEGQFNVSAALMSAANIGSKGQFAVKCRLDDEALVGTLPMGTAGSMAIYTDSGKPFHTISKVTIRMNAWLNYLIPL